MEWRDEKDKEEKKRIDGREEKMRMNDGEERRE